MSPTVMTRSTSGEAASQAPRSVPAGPSFSSVSIVLEWENVLLSERQRTLTALHRLLPQIRAVLAQPGHGGVRFEFILAFDSNHISEAQVTKDFRECLPPGWDIPTRTVGAKGVGYYGLKNEASKATTGDIIIQIDSDVIPEADWLAVLLSSFEDPRVEVVGSTVYGDGETTYERGMALGWIFPPAPAYRRLEKANQIFANSTAARREVWLKYPYPIMTAYARGACSKLARQLVAEGVGLFRNTGARMGHPPPNGFSHFARRAMAQGRDHLVDARERGRSTGLKTFRRPLKWLRRGVSKVFTHGSVVGLRWWQAPGAMAVMVAYYGFYFVGDVAHRIAPQRTAKWLNLGGHSH